MKNRKYRILMFAPLGLLALAAIGWLVMALWNWLMPELFGLREITYWQAWGLFILGKLLFGGLRGGGGRRGGHWRHRIMERMEEMTPEEREKCRQMLERRFGPVAPEAGPAQPPA